MPETEKPIGMPSRKKWQKSGILDEVLWRCSKGSVSKELKRIDKEPQELGLSEFEYAFYTAIADNGHARELMQKVKLPELAVVSFENLFENAKQNAPIDWTMKESVRAKLKVIVKRTLTI